MLMLDGHFVPKGNFIGFHRSGRLRNIINQSISEFLNYAVYLSYICFTVVF